MRAPTIDPDAVARLCELAQLDIGHADLERTTRALASIVAYATELADVDVDGVPPMDRPFDGEPMEGRSGEAISSALRPDTPAPELPRELALAAAPRSEGGAFDVPAFVDEA